MFGWVLFFVWFRSKKTFICFIFIIFSVNPFRNMEKSKISGKPRVEINLWYVISKLGYNPGAKGLPNMKTGEFICQNRLE